MRCRAIIAGVVGLGVWACGGSRSTPGLQQTEQASSGSCVPVDSGYGLGVPVYRECGVDQRAQIRRSPRAEFRPVGTPQPCYRAIVQMVVDENGEPIPGTARIVRTTNGDFGQATMNSALMARYHPARKGGVAVRQVVTFEQGMVVQVRISGEPSPPVRPRMNC
jgi:hypothetical protein